MLGRIAKIALVLTSFAPVFLTLAVIEGSKGGFSRATLLYIGVAVFLIIACLAIIKASGRRLAKHDFQITSLKTADSEIVGFMLAYLLPLVADSASTRINPAATGFVLLLFLSVVWSTHSYHFNPILGLCGYHFYEVETTGNVTYVLMTRRSLANTRKVQSVVQLTEYMVLDAQENE